MPGFVSKLRQSWNILTAKEVPPIERSSMLISELAAQRNYISTWRDTSTAVLAPIKTRIAIDVANVPIYHVRVNESGDFQKIIKGELNDRLSHQANIDQSGYTFLIDVVTTMLEHSCVAIVPTSVTMNPMRTIAYDPLSLRTGVVTEWFNKSARVSVYNEDTGRREEIPIPKSFMAICYNPLAPVMNEPNSTLRRLIDKLVLLDTSDTKLNSPNLDVILQLPYTIRSDRRQKEAEDRLAMLEEQLADSQYGIAYIDSVEKITQLNRPANNTLPDQITYLYNSLYQQLGLTEGVANGTASQEEMLNYYNRTVEPILKAVTTALEMSFLTKTARQQGQAIRAFPNLFKMAPIIELAEATDKFSRNEIMTSNELRSFLGLPRVNDKEADELRNKNLNKPVSDTNENGGENARQE